MLVLLSAAVSALALIGWLLADPFLRSFGEGGNPIWPWTAIGYLALSLGYLALFRGRTVLAGRILWLPLAIGAAAACEHLLGSRLGIDALLFPNQLAQSDAAFPGRTGMVGATLFVVLVIGAWTARSPAFTGLGTLLAGGTALSVGLAAALLTLLAEPNLQGAQRQMFGTPVPAVVAATLLALSVTIWSVELVWGRLFQRWRGEYPALTRFLPAMLLLPIVPVVVELLVTRSGLFPPVTAELLVICCNIAILVVLLRWIVERVARGQAELVEISEALDSATVAITTPDGTITHWPRGCERLYGWTAAEARGKNRYGLTGAHCLIERGPAGQMLDDSTTIIERRRDGSEVCVLERVHGVRIPGRAPRLVFNFTDVTRGTAALAALRASEERLAIATAVHELGVVEWDVSTGTLEWSPGAEQRLGMAPGSMSSFESWRANVEPEDLQQVLDTIAQAVRSHADRYTFRYRLRQPNGSPRSIEGASRAFYDAEGNLVRTVGAVVDVTARDEREAALRAREGQIRSIMETVPDALVVIDDFGRIREFSAAAEAMWGYRAADVMGKEFTLLTPVDQRAQYVELLRRYRQTGQLDFTGRTVPGIAEAADGRRFPIEGRTGLTQIDGQTLFTIFFRDVAERLATEERMSDLNAELAHVSRQSAMSELAADLAHELNQPLSAVSNFLAAARVLVERGDELERVSDLLRMGGEQTQRAGEIIRRLREFMSRREVDMRAISVDATVREAVDMVLVGTGQFDIRVTFGFDPAARLVLADRIQIQQVMVNLLRNAMDALRGTPRDQRQIHIASRKCEDGMVEVEVQDSGPGIPEPVLKHLYTRYVTTKGKSGMGIGLSISRRIIEAHGGTLLAENRTEGGAIFRFTLPALGEEDEE